ncbi:M28 family peptidase [Clostridium sp. LBM24168]
MKNKYRVLILMFLIISCCSFLGCSKLSFSDKKQSTTASNDLLEESNQQLMMNTIKVLASSNRQAGSNNEKKACEYIKNKIQSYGYETQIQTFSSSILEESNRGGLSTSQNLIAVKESNSNNKGVIIICAHYDSAKDSAGANDNASGVSVVMETARLLKNVSSDYELKFIFFGGEEIGGGIGSRYYINRLSSNEKENIKAVINIDSIAKKGASKPYIFTMNGKKNFAVTLLKRKPEDMNVKKTDREFSDYTIFDDNGIPSLCIGQIYDKNLKINGPHDTISTIDQSKLKLVADAIINSCIN